jgi:hypothetical protein
MCITVIWQTCSIHSNLRVSRGAAVTVQRSSCVRRASCHYGAIIQQYPSFSGLKLSSFLWTVFMTSKCRSSNVLTIEASYRLHTSLTAALVLKVESNAPLPFSSIPIPGVFREIAGYLDSRHWYAICRRRHPPISLRHYRGFFVHQRSCGRLEFTGCCLEDLRHLASPKD